MQPAAIAAAIDLRTEWGNLLFRVSPKQRGVRPSVITPFLLEVETLTTTSEASPDYSNCRRKLSQSGLEQVAERLHIMAKLSKKDQMPF